MLLLLELRLRLRLGLCLRRGGRELHVLKKALLQCAAVDNGLGVGRGRLRGLLLLKLQLLLKSEQRQRLSVCRWRRRWQRCLRRLAAKQGGRCLRLRLRLLRARGGGRRREARGDSGGACLGLAAHHSLCLCLRLRRRVIWTRQGAAAVGCLCWQKTGATG